MLNGLLLAGSLFGLDLVKDGKAISGVITDGTNPSLPLALEELLTYTKKVTGADLASAENPGIVIATLDSKLVPPGVREKLEAASEDEAFCLKTSDGKLYIIGKTGVGALYGTYELIEKHLGVRWFLRGKRETLGSKKDIVLPDMDEFHSPAFRYRILNQVSSHGLAREGRVWAARNRFASPGPWGIGDTLVKYRDFHEPRMILKRTSTGGHLTFELAVPTKQYATEHPEYFALVDGQRRTTGAHLHHCISNPEVQELLYQYIIRHFEKYGVENTSYLFGAPDTLQGWCECQECRNLDGGDGRNVSRRFHLVSQKIAKRVWEKFPDAELWVWAYWNYRESSQDVEMTRVRLFISAVMRVLCPCTERCLVSP